WLVGIEKKPQRLGPEERDVIALPLPGRRFAQRREQFIVGLRPGLRTAAIFQRSGDEDDGIAGDRELAPAALAPQLNPGLAAVADLQRRQSLGAGLARSIQCHLESEWKAVFGTCRRHQRG